MPIFWIANINIGAKRLLFLFGVEISLLLLTWEYSPTQPISLAIVGSLITLIITLSIAMYKYGIFIRKHSFAEHGEEYEVKDYLNLFKPLENCRILSRRNSNHIDSKIFLLKQKRWALFDNLRIVLQEQNIPKRGSVLLLGGGGGALAKTICQAYPLYHIDIIEISSAMIYAAKKYFFSPQETKRITILPTDAIKYITHIKKRYDIIIVDLFINSDISINTVKKEFISHLARLCASRTILFVNLFNIQETSLPEIIHLYQQAFPNFRLYTQGKTALIVARKLKVIYSNCTRVYWVKRGTVTDEEALLFSYAKGVQ